MKLFKASLFLTGLTMIGMTAELSAAAGSSGGGGSTPILVDPSGGVIASTEGNPKRVAPDQHSSSLIQNSDDAAREAGAALWKACDGNAACMDKAIQAPSSYEDLN